jgi:hypothetical protein
MACSVDGALRWSSFRVNIHVSKQRSFLLLTKSSSPQCCAFTDTELGDGNSTLSDSSRPRIVKLTRSRKSWRVCCEGVGDAGDDARSEALSVVVRSLVAAGVAEEDAVRISLKCPHFIQKLVGRSSEADEIVRWASLSLGAGSEDEVPSANGVEELSDPERWSVVLEFVGVHPQATTRISRVLSNSSLPAFLKKVCTPSTVSLTLQPFRKQF